MDTTKSTTVEKSGGAQKVEQTSATTKGAVIRRRANSNMVQNVLLIWLDNNIDDNSADHHNTITQLRRVINTINTFTDGDQCIQFIEETNNEKVCMIISGSLGQHIVPRIHNMTQVNSIFIFCDNKKRHEQLVKQWPKVKDVYTGIASISKALKRAVKQCEHNAISISFVPTTDEASSKNFDQLDPSFMYSQIVKEILLTIQFQEKHIKEFIEHCRDRFAENDHELNNINKFEQKYRDETPIWWYTYECFLYPMLNRALRLIDVDTIIKMGFFIGDLHRHIEQLHSEQFAGHHSCNSFIVYRGQGMSKTEFDQMMKTKSGLLSFNSFLSTVKNRKVSLKFAQRAVKNPDVVGILFVMTIDPSISATPFASINGVNCFEEKEDEVLFSMHTVFHIRDIKPMAKNHHLFQVDLTLTSDNDKDLRVLTDRIREETYLHLRGWERLGLSLLKMGQLDKAQQVYEVLLEQAINESEKRAIYHQIGLAKYNQGEYTEAITFYEKTLEIDQSLPPNYSNLATSYNNIGLVYYDMGEYSKALLSHERALEIRQKSLPSNHPDLASTYNNIGAVYYSMGEYSKALSSHEKALEIDKKTLPPNHLNLAMSYNNIGLVYYNMGEYLKALSYYEQDLEISQKILPLNHPDLAISYNNIGNVYHNMGENSKALASHEKALEIRQQSLPSNHPDLAASYNNIGAVYYNMDVYSKALSYYENDLEISQKTLPPNHPDLAMSYNNIGLVYEKMRNYSKARSFYENAVDIGQHLLPSNHPNLQQWRNNLADVKKKL